MDLNETACTRASTATHHVDAVFVRVRYAQRPFIKHDPVHLVRRIVPDEEGANII